MATKFNNTPIKTDTCMKKYCLAVDLKNDEKLIAEYEDWHKKVWPEIIDSIHQSGIVSMEIYRVGNRLFMIMKTTADFSFEQKAAIDAANTKVQEWEQLMWNYQQSLPFAKPGEKWVLMENIFSI
jgi:L-rhamnose mutarotase